jgi:hypothetical protein
VRRGKIAQSGVLFVVDVFVPESCVLKQEYSVDLLEESENVIGMRSWRAAFPHVPDTPPLTCLQNESKSHRTQDITLPIPLKKVQSPPHPPRKRIANNQTNASRINQKSINSPLRIPRLITNR